MQPRIVTAAAHCLRGLAGPLLPVSLCVTPAIPSLAAALPAPAKTTYRIVQLSPDVNAYGRINAKGQVAFTTTMDDAWESWFYDDAATHRSFNLTQSYP